ncbi:MAG: tRNA(Met) cytidine acetyltransferase TmcA [Candidatus Erwinia impunctatus]|nr:tRNA(Met) cytidine acetyltransferase TmcA [Culicoides impunctatus]
MNDRDLIQQSRIMKQQGIRRLLLLSGDKKWSASQIASLKTRLKGDWLWLGDAAAPETDCAMTQARGLLGREFLHAVFDARSGLNVEALAIIAGTLQPGSWLIMLVPEWSAWPQQKDCDSLRWTEGNTPVPSPHFIRWFQCLVAKDVNVVTVRQHETAPLVSVCTRLPDFPAWKENRDEQQQLLQQLLQTPAGITALIAPRGRGKSALAGKLVARWTGECLITAPARVSIEVLQQFAERPVNFIAPDELLAQCQLQVPQADWLIVDEAAAIPAPLLKRLALCFPRVLLMTTLQGYEGTGRGFLLKLCDGLPDVSVVSLTAPQRWAPDDPLERFINQLLLFEDEIPVAGSGKYTLSFPRQADWQQEAVTLCALYRMLAYAHYRTTPLDLRRMMDAPGMHFCVLKQDQIVQGGMWLVDEGELPETLAYAVWAGFRRPRGSLVAQSLAAHAGFPEAAQMRSRRIARIAVMPALRRQGAGRAMVANCLRYAEEIDFFSVSFGFTDELWSFWQACGFQLVRIGNKPEASSGCCTAMAILPLTPAALTLCQRVRLRNIRDAVPCQPDLQPMTLDDDDWQELAGFAWGQRSRETSEAALRRLLQCGSQEMPLLSEAIDGQLSIQQQCKRNGIAGRKALLHAWRCEVQQKLQVLDFQRSQRWLRRLEEIKISSQPGTLSS